MNQCHGQNENLSEVMIKIKKLFLFQEICELNSLNFIHDNKDLISINSEY